MQRGFFWQHITRFSESPHRRRDIYLRFHSTFYILQPLVQAVWQTMYLQAKGNSTTPSLQNDKKKTQNASGERNIVAQCAILKLALKIQN